MVSSINSELAINGAYDSLQLLTLQSKDMKYTPAFSAGNTLSFPYQPHHHNPPPQTFPSTPHLIQGSKAGCENGSIFGQIPLQ